MKPAPKKEAAPRLFPMFIKLAGRRCLVVGAGAVAESKIAGLLDAAAAVRVVAPEATPQVQSWAATGQMEWLARPCEPADLEGMFLVIAATSSPELHEQIVAEARQRGVLCNVVDVPELCDFYYPAVAQRGALQIAVSTAGQSPALSQRLRKELEEQFGPEYEAWLEQLGEERAKLFAAQMDPEERKRLLHDLASADAFKSFLRKHKRAKKG
jgi:precorrin-2 dehydrogenase / sirohydrochlorin ferrochelatase